MGVGEQVHKREPRRLVPGQATVEGAKRAIPWSRDQSGSSLLGRDIALVVVAAFLLRVILAVVLHYVVFAHGYSNFFTRGDDQGYDETAWQQTQVWRGTLPEVTIGYRYLLNVYTYTGAAVYLVFGHRVFAMIIVNCLFGALSAGVIFAIARQCFDRQAALVAAIATAFLPTIAFWSLLNLKDAMYLFLMTLAMWIFTTFLKTGNRWLIVPVLLVLALIGGLRLVVQGILTLIFPIAVVLQPARAFQRKWSTAALLLGCCAVLLWFSGGAAWIAEALPRANIMRSYTSQGAGSGFAPVAPSAAPQGPAAPSASTTSTPAGDPGTGNAPSAAQEPQLNGRHELRTLIRWLPMGLVYATLAPFPWSAARLIERALIPDMLLWYGALILAGGAIVVYRRRFREFAHLLGYIAAILLAFAAASGNVGLIVRQRSMMVAPFILIFSGAGAVWLWRWWWSKRAVRPAAAGSAIAQDNPTE